MDYQHEVKCRGTGQHSQRPRDRDLLDGEEEERALVLDLGDCVVGLELKYVSLQQLTLELRRKASLTASRTFLAHSSGLPFLKRGIATARSAPFLPASTQLGILLTQPNQPDRPNQPNPTKPTQPTQTDSPVSTPAKTFSTSTSHTSATCLATASLNASIGTRSGSAPFTVGSSGRAYWGFTAGWGSTTGGAVEVEVDMVVR
jgi:hypothetical protein